MRFSAVQHHLPWKPMDKGLGWPRRHDLEMTVIDIFNIMGHNLDRIDWTGWNTGHIIKLSAQKDKEILRLFISICPEK